MKAWIFLLAGIVICADSLCQNRDDYDSAQLDFSIGGVFRISTGDGVGVNVRKSIAPRLYLRARVDALFAESAVLDEYNYVEFRPGINYDLPVKNVILYFGLDGFFGFFQNALNKSITHRELGVCGVSGVRTYPIFDHISIGLETGPKVAHRFGQTDDVSKWDGQLLNDFFVYLTFRF